MKSIVDAAPAVHADENHDSLAAAMTGNLKKTISREGFHKARMEIESSMDKLDAKRLPGSLNRSGNPMLIYVAKHQKITDDILIQVTF